MSYKSIVSCPVSSLRRAIIITFFAVPELKALSQLSDDRLDLFEPISSSCPTYLSFLRGTLTEIYVVEFSEINSRTVSAKLEALITVQFLKTN